MLTSFLVTADNMRNLFFRLVMVFSVFLAGIHLPVSAQPVDLAGHHDSHVAASHDLAGDDHEMPADQDCDFIHHHHCPPGLLNTASSEFAPLFGRNKSQVAQSSVALNSRATAPPLKPPSA
jgi:hypothetical protein